MKHMLFPLLTLFLLGSLAFANAGFITGQVELWCGEVEQAQQAARSEDWDETLRTLERIQGRWDTRETYFHIVVRHEELSNAESLLAETRAFAAEQHDAEFHASAAKLITQLRHLAEAEKLSIKNVL